MQRRWVLTGLMVALLLVLTGCGRPAAPQGQQGAAGDAQDVRVTAREFSYSPADVTVSVNQPVRLTLVNEGVDIHDWSVPELGISTNVIQAGQQITIEFTPGRTGEFRVVCTVPGHEAAGMVGRLIVQ